MVKASLSNKVFTENPLLDEIVYNARQLATGVILKDSGKADKYETLESLQNGDVLIAVNNGTASFNSFYYDKEVLEIILGDDPNIPKYVLDNSLIPKGIRPQLFNKASELFLENYEEQNNYYRMLHGLPEYDETGVYEGLWIDVNAIDESSPTSLSSVSIQYKEEKNKYGIVTSDYRLIHELSHGDITILQNNGTFENIIEAETALAAWGLTQEGVRYLNYLGDKTIDYYDARRAGKFEMLFCPSCDSDEVKQRFKDLFEANRLYMLYTIYSDAYKYKSDYYDNFMMVLLIIQTIVDMIVELPEYVIRRDIFDTRTCKYMFEANGVKYFRTIPLKYQISLVKNLNKILKFKSTDKCIVDIVSLFGYSNINAFRYYILKDRNVTMTDDGIYNVEYYNETKSITDTMGNTSVVPDYDKNYEVKFVKVPLQDMYDSYIRTENNILEYDELTSGDDYWLGDKDYDTIKSAVKELDFTVLRSKYYSVEAVIDVAQRNFTIIYFMNILMYNNVNKDALAISLPNISTKKKVTLVNAILALYSLSYIYYGVEDTIMNSADKIACILGFNMEADLGTIASYLKEYHGGLTLDELFYDHETLSTERHGFQIPDNNKIISFEQLQQIFRYNKKIYDHVQEVMIDPPSKEVYDAYRYLYKSLFIMNRNMEYFLIGNNDEVTEYKAKGYKTKFITIPRSEDYESADHFDRDYKWFLSTLEENILYFEQSADFEDTNEFDLYIYDGTDFINLSDYHCPKCGNELTDGTITTCPYCGESITPKKSGATARMATTYREFLRYNDASVYSYLENIANIVNVDSRQEACVNAIQQITGYIKDYIDEDGVDEDSSDDIRMDDVFSSLPSISIDFIKDYIEEVVDFFKSFKIFTHQSSIVYVFEDRFENYIQLIDHILLKYLLDKGEFIKIEDAIGENRGKLNPKERAELIDKVWFDIDTWVLKTYGEYYNNENYKEAQDRIKDIKEYFSTFDLGSHVFDENWIEDIEDFAVDAILKLLVDLTLETRTNIVEKIAAMLGTKDIDTYYNEWMADLAILTSTFIMYDGDINSEKYFCNHCNKEIADDSVVLCPHCGNIIEEPIVKKTYKTHIIDTYEKLVKMKPESKINIVDGNTTNDQTVLHTENISLTDAYYTTITASSTAHVFQ